MRHTPARLRWPVLSRAGELVVMAIPALVLLIAAGVRRRGAIMASLAPVATAQAATHASHARSREQRPVLRVCADPNNLPFSNRAGQGYENRIAELLARAEGARLEYAWWPQRRGFVRSTLKAGRCDVVMGVPAGYDMALTTEPYYRSTYVFVTRRDGPRLRSLNDPALKRLRIGIHAIGDDYANSPAAAALARRGLAGNVVGYSIYGDYSKPDPPAELVRAVERGDVDVAVAWGPLAGWYAQRSRVPLRLVPVTPQVEWPYTMFVFDIAVGVRRGDSTTRARVERALVAHEPEVREILEAYGVPLVEGHPR
jgi:mxaJ protein